MKEYKPGTLVEYDDYVGKELLIILEQAERTILSDGPLYNVYNYTTKTFMQRSQSFLDKYYLVIG